MVCEQGKALPVDIVVKLAQCKDDCEEFPLGSRIIVLRGG